MKVKTNAYGVRYIENLNIPKEYHILTSKFEDGSIFNIKVPTITNPERITEVPYFVVYTHTNGTVYFELTETKYVDNTPNRLSYKQIDSISDALDETISDKTEDNYWDNMEKIWNENTKVFTDLPRVNLYGGVDLSWANNFEDKYDPNFLGYDEEGNRLTKQNTCES